MSGSYLLAEDGGPRSRTGGISASLSTPDGHVIGGGIATLIASSPVQVSFFISPNFTYNCTLMLTYDVELRTIHVFISIVDFSF